MCKNLKALSQQIASVLNNDNISEENRITKVLSKTKLYATTIAKNIQIPNDLLEDISIIQNTDITIKESKTYTFCGIFDAKKRF